jgi:hypothetical protein
MISTHPGETAHVLAQHVMAHDGRGAAMDRDAAMQLQ